MLSEIIYGIDVAKGSPRANEVPRYAVAVLKDGEVTHHTMVRRHRILRMINRDMPSIIAVDNIFELAADKRELTGFLSRLPEGVKLVQVTGGMHKRPLVRLAHEKGISFNQFNPNEEAETCARLAASGVGCEVSLFEDITKIKVSRARSLGRGGWSQNRYRRKVHGAVKVKSREVEAVLKKAAKERGFTFTSRIAEGFGGYVRCEFTINARRDSIPVHPSVTSDVQVTVKSVEREKIKYIPLKDGKRSFTIVGVDPGTTVGIAILSFEGDLLYLKSFRGISHDEVVKLIAEYGKPAIVATDVTPTPSAVEKIRRSFNALINTPGSEISSEEKIAMGRPFGYSNDHERDSLSAALSAFKSYKNIFSRIEKRAPPGTDVDQIKMNVIKGDSIEDAIEKVVSPAKPKAKPKVAIEKEPESELDEQNRKLLETLKRQSEQIHHLQEYVAELKKDVSSKDKRISKLESNIGKMREGAYKEIKKDKEIQIRDRTITRIKKELKDAKKSLKKARFHSKKLKKIRKMEIKGEGLPVKILSSFTREAISKTKELYGIKKGDILYLDDSSGGGAGTASILVDAGIRAVVASHDLSHAAHDCFFKGNIPVLLDVPIQRVEDFAVVDPEKLDAAILEWESAAKEVRKKEEEQHLEFLVQEYRSERRRGLA